MFETVIEKNMLLSSGLCNASTKFRIENNITIYHSFPQERNLYTTNSK